MSDNKRNPFTTRRMPQQAGEAEIVLESIDLSARGPFGGFVWNRPAAVFARSPDGDVATATRLPIPDLTRRWQVILYGIALFFALAGLMSRGRAAKE